MNEENEERLVAYIDKQINKYNRVRNKIPPNHTDVISLSSYLEHQKNTWIFIKYLIENKEFQKVTEYCKGPCFNF